MEMTEKFKNTVLAETNIGPRGYVVIRDKKGNILVDQHNMILKCGRDFLFDLFKKAHGNTDGTPSFIKYAVFTNETQEPKFEDIGITGNVSPLLKVWFNIERKLRTVSNDSGIDAALPDKPQVDVNEGTLNNHNFLVFSFKLQNTDFTGVHPEGSGSSSNLNEIENNATQVIALSSLYLFLEGTNEGSFTDGAFSKIVFDSIPLSGLDELSLDYYIYF